MRRHDREVHDITEILSVIDRCKVLRIAMVDEGKPYLVPLNYGYSYHDEKLTFFCHSAPVGRKISILQKNPTVFFELDTDHALIANEQALSYSYRYSCVMGEGRVRFLQGDEKRRALSNFMLHQTGTDPLFPPERLDAVTVFALEAVSFTAKARK